MRSAVTNLYSVLRQEKLRPQVCPQENNWKSMQMFAYVSIVSIVWARFESVSVVSPWALILFMIGMIDMIGMSWEANARSPQRLSPFRKKAHGLLQEVGDQLVVNCHMAKLDRNLVMWSISIQSVHTLVIFCECHLCWSSLHWLSPQVMCLFHSSDQNEISG
jgi:hypothetical protein